MIKIALRLFASILLVLTIAGTAEAVQPKVTQKSSSKAASNNSKPKTTKSKSSSKNKSTKTGSRVSDPLIKPLVCNPNTPTETIKSFLDGIEDEDINKIIACCSNELQRQIRNELYEYGEDQVFNELMENPSIWNYKNNFYEGWELGFVDWGDSTNFWVVYIPAEYIGNSYVSNIDYLEGEVLKFRMKREAGQWKVKSIG